MCFAEYFYMKNYDKKSVSKIPLSKSHLCCVTHSLVELIKMCCMQFNTLNAAKNSNGKI